MVNEQLLGFYSSFFLVEKASGGWRSVINPSPLNKFIHQTLFKMETVTLVPNCIRKSNFMVSIDLKDVYF